MKIQVIRYSTSKKDTLSLIFLNELFECYGLEDSYHKTKIKHKTRIPDGIYNLDWNKNITPMTVRYRKKFKWFKYHLEVKNVENFSNIYIHIGNTSEDTSGCLLLGDTTKSNKNSGGFISNSTSAYKRFYEKIRDLLISGEKVTIEYKTYI